MKHGSGATEHAQANTWIGAPEHVNQDQHRDTDHVTQEAHAAHAATTHSVSDRRNHNAMQSEGWGLRSDGTLGVRSGAKEHASREDSL